MEIQKTRVKQRNQIHCPFAHVNAGIVQASSRASVQYRAYTLTLWSGALVASVWVFAAHLSTTPEKAGFTSASEG